MQRAGPIPSVSELLFGLGFSIACALPPDSCRRGVRTSYPSPVLDPSATTRSDRQEFDFMQTLCVSLRTEINSARFSGGRMSTGSGLTLQLTHTKDAVQQRSACEFAPKANLSISG